MFTYLSSKMWKPTPLGIFSDNQWNKEEDIRICNFCLWGQLVLRSFDSKKNDPF